MDNLMGAKELYDVVIKTTYPIDAGKRKIEAGEVIASFDNIQIANFKEIKDRVSARGGFDNRGWVFWDETNEVKIDFTQGIFSKTQLALLSNSRLVSQEANEVILFKRENHSVDENNCFVLTEQPVGEIFVYDKITGQKLLHSINDEGIVTVNGANEVIVDYNYTHKGAGTKMIIGQRLVAGFLTLEGKTRLKDDTTGHVITGIIKIPKLKLMSDLSMRLGKNATPTVANFSVVGLPTGSKGTKKVMEFIYLDEDIDADI